jgi:hypothetical protein
LEKEKGIKGQIQELGRGGEEGGDVRLGGVDMITPRGDTLPLNTDVTTPSKQSVPSLSRSSRSKMEIERWLMGEWEGRKECRYVYMCVYVYMYKHFL